MVEQKAEAKVEEVPLSHLHYEHMLESPSGLPKYISSERNVATFFTNKILPLFLDLSHRSVVTIVFPSTLFFVVSAPCHSNKDNRERLGYLLHITHNYQARKRSSDSNISYTKSLMFIMGLAVRRMNSWKTNRFMCYHTAGTTTLNVISILRGAKGGPMMAVGTPMTSFLPCTRSAEIRLEVSVQADNQME
eukprot:scaffold26340_cov103-Cylindrotheca_fusiformis.AAC.2